MKFKISSKILKKYPKLIEAVVILRDIDNTVGGKEVLKLLREEEKKKRKEFKDTNLTSHPQIRAWQEAFKSFGSKPNKYSSSIEALLKRVIKGQELPDINPLVNLYNYCSIKHILPFGGEDFAGLYGDMELKFCDGIEEFIPIFGKESEPPDKGEISWVDDKGVTCRKWNWRQCDRTKITENTKQGYFIIDGLPPATEINIKKAAEDFISLAKKYLNAKGEVYWLDKNNLETEVDIETKKTIKEERGKTKDSSSLKSKGTKIKKQKEQKNPLKDLVDEDLQKLQLRKIIYEALKKSGYNKYLKKEDIEIEHPQNESFGDYTSNYSFLISKKIKKDPLTIGNEIKECIENELKGSKSLTGISYWPDNLKVIGGFTNIWLSREFLVEEIKKIITQKDKYGSSLEKKNFKLIVEFGQPNTHKMPHIGHLFSYVFGESIARITETMGIKIFRANYQGDVGPHVAKCIWALKKFKPDIPKTLRGKADVLQLMYQKGATAYKEDEKVKKEIAEINKKIYLKDPSIENFWEETRSWSIDLYKKFESSIGVHYDRYYFESEAAPIGKKIVESNVGKVFEKSQGAIIFEGSKYGLHDRVFITKKGTPTYEAKDMGLQTIKYKEWPFDYMIIATAHEQSEYFKVVIKALEELDSKFIGKIRHFGFGMVRLKSGKMSSRLGNIITGIGLVEQAVEAVGDLIREREKFTNKEREEIAEKVGIAAVKYSFLKNNPLQDSTFDFEESINFEGNSGPYLQYTYARAKSILKETKSPTASHLTPTAEFNKEEMAILRTLYRFPEVVSGAGINLAPNLICNFLFDLAQKFNLFYKKHPVLKAESGKRETRIALTSAVAQVLKNGLHLLGIEVLEKM